MEVPCGQCMGCRIARAREWAIRCMHEASEHQHNQFLTLTYADEHLPQWGSLDKSAFPLFMKRLRKEIGYRVSYFYVGEYGENTKRPHYHALLFGLAVPDAVAWTEHDKGKLYTSQALTRLWGQGHVVIGPVTYETAAYCARYNMKKVTGQAAKDHYTRVDPETGEVYELVPEFIGMSRRPAIGRTWFEKFHTDLYPSDEAIHKGKSYSVPKYYDRLLDRVAPLQLQEIKEERVKRANTIDRKKEQTPHRRAVRAEVSRLKAEHQIKGRKL